MPYTVDTYWWSIVIAIAVFVVAVVAALAIWRGRTQSVSRESLRAEFGSEYDRAVAEYGSEARARRELLARKRRVSRYPIHPLHPDELESFSVEWSGIQREFVDDPVRAVGRAHEVVKELMEARGYPMEDFDKRIADLSVGHARVVDHYRAARTLYVDNQAGNWDTEELRQAMVHYRALFGDLLEQPPRAMPYGPGLKEAPL
jgi:hypothetical protein